MSQIIHEETTAGQLQMTEAELAFLYELTGKTTPNEAAEQFAVACVTVFKEPQDVLRSLQIAMGPAEFGPNVVIEETPE